jgi:YegS/Rv2252/BmrU family lipid kinase
MLKYAMRAVLIANANAGQRRREEYATIVRGIVDDLVEEQHWTGAPGDAARLSRQIAASGQVDAILVAGGDGTVNEVATGIMSAAPGDRPAIGIVPMGTCNILANELGLLNLEHSELRAALQSGATRSIDVGRVADRCFVLMAGYGFDAATVRQVILPIKGVIGAPAYVLSAIATLAAYQPSRIVLRFDDDVVETQAFMVLVANVSSYAYQQMKLAPFASPDDGWLDICVFEKAPAAKMGFVNQFFLMMASRHLGDPRVRYYRARKIAIESEPPMPGQLDGEAFGETPTTITLDPKALRFLVPQSLLGK